MEPDLVEIKLTLPGKNVVREMFPYMLKEGYEPVLDLDGEFQLFLGGGPETWVIQGENNFVIPTFVMVEGHKRHTYYRIPFWQKSVEKI